MERWLTPQDRSPNSYRTFTVIDYLTKPITDDVKNYLCELLKQNRINPAFLEAAKKRLSWHKLKLVEQAKIPNQLTVQRGDFGEAVATAVLVKLHGYRVPVQKLRFAVTGNQSLPSTDVLAVKENSNRLTEVCFVESKLRTTTAKQAAVQGYKQLEHDQSLFVPHMIVFVAERLFEAGDPMADKLLDYLNSREDMNLDTSSLNLFFDDSVWTDELLENLEAVPSKLPRLTTRVVRVKELAALTNELFGHLGVEHIIDEEDE